PKAEAGPQRRRPFRGSAGGGGSFGGSCRAQRRRSSRTGSELRPLAHLAGDVLAGVANSLALVGLRGTNLPDARGDLANRLLVDASDDDLGRHWDLEVDALRCIHPDRMRVADCQLERLAAKLRPVSDSLDLQPLLEPFGDTLHHVEYQCAGQAVKRSMILAVARP